MENELLEKKMLNMRIPLVAEGRKEEAILYMLFYNLFSMYET